MTPSGPSNESNRKSTQSNRMKRTGGDRKECEEFASLRRVRVIYETTNG